MGHHRYVTPQKGLTPRKDCKSSRQALQEAQQSWSHGSIYNTLAQSSFRDKAEKMTGLELQPYAADVAQSVMCSLGMHGFVSRQGMKQAWGGTPIINVLGR